MRTEEEVWKRSEELERDRLDLVGEGQGTRNRSSHARGSQRRRKTSSNQVGVRRIRAVFAIEEGPVCNGVTELQQGSQHVVRRTPALRRRQEQDVREETHTRQLLHDERIIATAATAGRGRRVAHLAFIGTLGHRRERRRSGLLLGHERDERP